MRRFGRAALPVTVTLVLALAATACGDDGGGGDGTISKDDWIDRAEAVCQQANADAENLDAPEFDVADPADLTDEQLRTGARYLDQLVSILDGVVADLDDLPVPASSDDQDTVNEIVDGYGKALQSLRDARNAADAADVAAFVEHDQAFQQEIEATRQEASAFGLTDCGTGEA